MQNNIHQERPIAAFTGPNTMMQVQHDHHHNFAAYPESTRSGIRLLQQKKSHSLSTGNLSFQEQNEPAVLVTRKMDRSMSVIDDLPSSSSPTDGKRHVMPTLSSVSLEPPHSPSMEPKTRRLLPEVTSTGMRAFPFTLHDLLDHAETQGFANVISWNEDGNSFKVHERHLFASDVLPAFFQGQSQYKSFQRQCNSSRRQKNQRLFHLILTFTPFNSTFVHSPVNIYGFTRITKRGPNQGGYTHELFVRGQPMWCRFMVRIKVKSKGESRTPGSSFAIRKLLPTSKKMASGGSFLLPPAATTMLMTSPPGAPAVGCFAVGNFVPQVPSDQLASLDDSSSSNNRVDVDILLSVKKLLETLQSVAPSMNDFDRERYTKNILELSASTLKSFSHHHDARNDTIPHQVVKKNFSSSPALGSSQACGAQVLSSSTCRRDESTDLLSYHQVFNMRCFPSQEREPETFRQLEIPMYGLDDDLDDIFGNDHYDEDATGLLSPW
jgi:hypothetical protein